MKYATKADLKDQILTNDSSILFNPETGEEYSANAGDYWDLPDDHEFTGFILVTKNTVYNEVSHD